MHRPWADDVKAEGGSRVTYEIEQVAQFPPVTHDQLREGANDQLYGGWPMILSGLKTWSSPASSSPPPATHVSE